MTSAPGCPANGGHTSFGWAPSAPRSSGWSRAGRSAPGHAARAAAVGLVFPTGRADEGMGDHGREIVGSTTGTGWCDSTGIGGDQGGSPLWAGVDRLAATAPTLGDLIAHRLHLVEARRLRRRGEPVPEELSSAERGAALMRLGASAVLGRAREAYDGSLVLLKGPEVAASYPDPGMRPFTDLDLLPENADAAQAALVAAGFMPLSDASAYDELHHLAPLALPGLPVIVEVHRTPKWLSWMTPPANEELFAAAVPSSTGAKGILGLRRDHHALVLAAHSWSHNALGRILDMVDIAAVGLNEPAEHLEHLGRQWGMVRVWGSTVAVIDHLLLGYGRRSVALHTWARNLRDVRSRTVLGWHLERWIGPYWGMGPVPATRQLINAVWDDARPMPGETWGDKLVRSQLAIRHALRRRSQHDAEWGRIRQARTGDTTPE